MNRRLLSVFLFALVVAGISSFLLYHVILLHAGAPGRAVSKNRLTVAARDLQVGTLIHDYDLQEVAWAGTLPEHAIRNRKEAIGQGVVATIYRNEPIIDTRLAAKGAGAGLAATIPMGKRAVALRVNDVVGLAGFVLPGMRVDVLIAGTPPGDEGKTNGLFSRTVLQNIEVLSAGQRLEKNSDGKPQAAQVVNLLVTPDQAEILNLASSQAKIQLVLRNPLDTTEEATHGVSSAALFGRPEAAAVATPVAAPASKPVNLARQGMPTREDDPAVDTIEVFNGVSRSEQKFAIARDQKR